MCDELLELCSKRNFTLIGGLKANRTILAQAPAQGNPSPRLLALNQFAPTLPKEAYQAVTLGKQTFRLAGVQTRFKGGGGRTVKVVVSRSLQAQCDPRCGIKAYNYRFFVSSDPALTVKTICEFYSVRWEIETFHAQAKELLGLDHRLQVKSLKGLSSTNLGQKSAYFREVTRSFLDGCVPCRAFATAGLLKIQQNCLKLGLDKLPGCLTCRQWV